MSCKKMESVSVGHSDNPPCLSLLVIEDGLVFWEDGVEEIHDRCESQGSSETLNTENFPSRGECVDVNSDTSSIFT